MGDRNQRGLSLVELMISLAFACLLLSALLSLFISCKTHYLNLQTILETEYELQLVSELLRDSSRSAGFMPCLGLNHLTSKDGRDPRHRLSAIALDVGKLHALQFSHMSEHFVKVNQVISPTRLLIEGSLSLPRGRPIVLADCYFAEVQRVSHSQPSGKNTLVSLEKPLSFSFHPPVYLGEWVEERYYVGTNSQGEQALFYDANRGEELTNQVVHLAASFVRLADAVLLKITLNSVQGRLIELDTRLRTP
jgi:hypothetical protein